MLNYCDKEGRNAKLHVFSKPVTNISHCTDKSMAGALNLAPESPYVDIHRSVAAVVIVAPDFVEQSLAGKDSATVARQEFEKLIFPEGQHNRPAVHGYLAPSLIYHQVTAGN